MKSKSEALAIRGTVAGKKREARKKISTFLFTVLLLNLWYSGCRQSLKEEVIPKSELKEDFKGVLTIVDVSNSRQPIIVSSTSLPWEPDISNSTAVWKQFLLATSPYGVHLLDVENLEQPKPLWNLSLATPSGEVVVFKDYAFLPSQEGLYVLHLTNPLQPQWVVRGWQKGNLNSYLIDLKIKGEYAYTLDGDKYLHVLDLSVPEHPKLIDSYAVSLPSFQLFRVLGDKAQPISPPRQIDSLTHQARFSHLDKLNLPTDLSTQLSNRSHLIGVSANSVVKIRMSQQYICWLYLRSDPYRLWLIPPENNSIHSLDIALEHTKYLYMSERRELPQHGNLTDIIKVSENQLYLISQDNWMQAVNIEREEWGPITDFQLSENLVYITQERGVLFIAELSNEGLKGIAALDDLPQRPQSLTLDKNYLYLLGKKFPLEVRRKE